METYKHSGSVPALGIIVAPGIGILTAAVLGVIYTYGVVYIPFIYVNFLLTIGLGMCIGLAVGFAAKVTKIRNNGVTAFLGLACGLVGLYAAWSVDLMARAGIGFDALLLRPDQIWAYMGVLYENGSWGFGNTPVTGIFLVVIWLIETAIVLVASALLALGVMAGSVFCETCRRWIKTEEDVKKLSLDDVEGVLQNIATANFAALAAHPHAAAGAAAYVRLDLTCCSTCQESNYLTVAVMKHSVDNKGNKSTSKEDFVTNLAIEPDQVEQVRAAGSAAPPSPSPFPMPEEPQHSDE